MNFENILKNGTTIRSSGTTGDPKQIYRSPSNLKACIDVAVSAQQLTQRSRVLTVTRMTHAGGLLTQTLPAYSIGADFKIQQFNAFTFLKDFADYTHTFLTPAHMTALMKTKGFKNCNLSGKWILGGSDPVSWEMIEAFVSKGAVVQPNWGMSEVGPIAINTVFDTIDKVQEYKQRVNSQTILGDTVYCDIKIIDNVLYVKGNLCYVEGWHKTNDIVDNIDNIFIYNGRS
jgi:acyl-CoA synthetase (AMP-forming)/AMP-acid ligase II|tara:strand:- start:972 stop:1661 length:690 start_codon:yes stop_codon:yes gene_type:complete